QNRQP
ncbi:NADPH-dependent FMN reductase family protein, partial [Vibrio parahaemolyticus AQ3810]